MSTMPGLRRMLHLGLVGALVGGLTIASVGTSAAAGLVSDDFSSGLDTSRWSVVDPVGDGSVTTSGQGTSDAVVELSVPAGTSHDPWGTNRSLRLMQPAGDGDFEVEVKFDSVPAAKYQMQGLIVAQDPGNWLRFDTYHDGSNLRAFAASTTGGATTAKLSKAISVSGGSVWLQVARAGDTWSYSWSADGASFASVGSFTQALAVSSLGPFAANHKPNPAFTAAVDYVFDTAAPIEPEDGSGEPDTTAPVISDVAVATSDTSATVTWTTDEPATSGVSYGPTAGYEDGTVSDANLVTGHEIRLTGLSPESTYHYQAASTDAAGNPATTLDATFTTDASPTATHTLTVATTGQGTVTTDPPGPDHPADTTVTLTATPAEGWVFQGWSGDVTGADNPTTIVMDADHTVTATFAEDDPIGDTAPPVIDVWYGDSQTFGDDGRPQRWVNVLGNVSDPDGVASLTYRLNGGSGSPLSIGPDLRRLQFPGDFNVEIDYLDLDIGANDLKIVAVDDNGHESSRTVTVHRAAATTPSIPTTIDWSSATEPNDVAQVVDGKWQLDGAFLRPLKLGYDRLVAIGDTSWTDYEVTVPLTVHGLGPDSGTPQSGAPLVGMGLRWPGHTPSAGQQPSQGFYPVGAYAWYRWQNGGRNELTGSGGSPVDRLPGPLELGTPYVMKASVQSVPDGTQYRYKMWRAADPEPGWQMEIVYDGGTDSGGVALIAHHVDVSIGDVSVGAAS